MAMTTSLPDDFDELLDRATERGRAWRFILPAILGLLLLVAVVTIKQGYFVRRAQLDFYAPTAEGVAVGTRIKLLGFPIGSVTAVRFIPASAGQGRRVKFDARIDAEYLANIPSGSRARLTQEGVIGERIIEILPGVDSARPMAAGESIELTTSGGLSELAATVEARILPIADEARNLLHAFNDERTGVKPMITDFRAVAGGVNTSVQQVGKMLTNADAKLEKIMVEGEATMKSMHVVAATAERRSGELLDDAQATLKSVRAVTADAADITREIRGATPGLVADGQSAVSDVSEITRGAKRSWPINLFVTEPAVESLGVDTGSLPRQAGGAR